MAKKPDLLQAIDVEKTSTPGKTNTVDESTEIESDSKTVSADTAITEESDGSIEKSRAPRKWRGPPKNSSKYGIKHSLQKMSVKYTPAKVEEPPKPVNPCSPCSREQKDVEAANYCPECKEMLCVVCTSQHRKFQILKTHKIHDVKEAPKTDSVTPVVNKLSETCANHASKLIDMFCRQHDEVGCAACIAINHKECMAPEYISNIATSLMKSDLPKETKEELGRVKKDIFMLKVRRLGDKNRIAKERDEIVLAVDNVKARFVETLDQLELAAKEKLRHKFDRDMQNIQRDVHNCDNATASLDESLKKMKADSPGQLMINIKKDGKKSLRQGEKVILGVTEKLGSEEIKFTVDESLEEWLSKFSALGKFDHEESVFTGVIFGKYDLDQKSDPEKDGYIFNGLLNLPNGFTVVSDWKNKRLKLLDTNYNLRSHCDVPGMPYSLCCIKPDLVAVSIRDEKIIQFVAIEDTKMKLDRKFKIDEYCRGIAYKNNHLYVTCGGGEGEIHGQLRTYSLHGALVRTYEEDIQSKPFFTKPKDIIINDEGTRFHVTDLKRGVVTVTKDGRLASVFDDRDLKSPLGMCMDGKGNLFVSGSDSNNVIQLSADGKKLGEVLKEEDGVNKPLAICCHESINPRLIISSEESCTLKVFTLQEKF